jgi:hypothetical protein
MERKERAKNLKIIDVLRISWKIIKSLEKETFTNNLLSDRVLKNNIVRIEYSMMIKSLSEFDNIEQLKWKKKNIYNHRFYIFK